MHPVRIKTASLRRWPAVVSLAAALGFAAAMAADAPAGPAPVYDGPLAAPSPLYFHFPPFDKLSEADFRDAFAAGMARQLQEVAVIARDPQPPTFDNTIVALERSGELLERAMAVFFNLTASNTNPSMQQFESEMAPQLAAHEDAILLDPELFARVRDAVRAARHAGAGSRGSCSCWSAITRSSCAPGRALSAAQTVAPARRSMSRSPASRTRFKQNVLKATSDGAVVVDDRGGAGRACPPNRSGPPRAGRGGPRPGGQMADHAAEHHHPAAAGAADPIARCASACSRPRPPAASGGADGQHRGSIQQLVTLRAAARRAARLPEPCRLPAGG